jgi:hypothetical protein
VFSYFVGWTQLSHILLASGIVVVMDWVMFRHIWTMSMGNLNLVCILSPLVFSAGFARWKAFPKFCSLYCNTRSTCDF